MIILKCFQRIVKTFRDVLFPITLHPKLPWSRNTYLTTFFIDYSLVQWPWAQQRPLGLNTEHLDSQSPGSANIHRHILSDIHTDCPSGLPVHTRLRGHTQLQLCGDILVSGQTSAKPWIWQWTSDICAATTGRQGRELETSGSRTSTSLMTEETQGGLPDTRQLLQVDVGLHGCIHHHQEMPTEGRKCSPEHCSNGHLWWRSRASSAG